MAEGKGGNIKKKLFPPIRNLYRFLYNSKLEVVYKCLGRNLYNRIDRSIYEEIQYLYIEKNIEEVMKMTYKTKTFNSAGSMITVVPSALKNLLKIENGDNLIWNVDITEEGATVTIIPEKEEKE